MRELIIYGAGGFARELVWLTERSTALSPRYRVIAMIDDDPAKEGALVNDIPIMRLEKAAPQFPDASYIVGVGKGADRQRLAARCEAHGILPATLIHTTAEHSRWVEVGEGTVICAGAILTTNVNCGRHVQINLNCTIGHDTVLDDFVTLAPGVHVSGRVHIACRAYLGTGAVILPGPPGGALLIGEDAIVGAGAVVTRDVAPGTTVVGVPARPLRDTSGM